MPTRCAAMCRLVGPTSFLIFITAARKLMTFLGEKPNIGVILDILPGTDGEVKMSKSLGNYIPLLSTAEDMYGKLMSIPDKAMGYYFRLITRWTPPEIQEIETGLAAGTLHPRDVENEAGTRNRLDLPFRRIAELAEQAFVRVFQQGDIPEEMAEYALPEPQALLDVIVNSGLVSSKNEGRRMISQHAVRLDGVELNDPQQMIAGPGVLQVGKRRYLRLVWSGMLSASILKGGN